MIFLSLKNISICGKSLVWCMELSMQSAGHGQQSSDEQYLTNVPAT